MNAARKAEAKVKKISADREQRLAQWARYQKEVREAFLSEHRRHTSNMQQLEADMVKALAAQEEARSKVRNAAIASAPASEASRRDLGMDVHPWDCLVCPPEVEEVPDDYVLQEVLARAFAGLPTCLRPCRQHPPHRPQGLSLP